MAFRLTELPEAMRDFGVDVVEVAGWQSRGVAFPRAPIGGLDHWTVGPATGEAPSLAVVTYGRSDLAGPLCNVLRGRRTNGRIRAFMVASGRANHGGRGQVHTTSGVANSNNDLFGLEVEYRPWAEPITDDDLDVDARIHAAAAQVCGYEPADVFGHWEFATPRGRKVDRNTISTPHLRALIARVIEEDYMARPRRIYLGKTREDSSWQWWMIYDDLALAIPISAADAAFWHNNGKPHANGQTFPVLPDDAMPGVLRTKHRGVPAA